MSEAGAAAEAGDAAEAGKAGESSDADHAAAGEAVGAAVGAAMVEELGTPPPPAYRVMNLVEVVLDLPNQYPAVTLTESEPPMRTLVFPLGLAEGTALALAERRMRSPRPLTHELFMDVLQRARIDVIALRLTGRDHGNYLAELDLMTPSGRERLECRPSDGMVLAMRMPVPSPILCDERLLESAGDVTPQSE
jgi:uncharacterized protein